MSQRRESSDAAGEIDPGISDSVATLSKIFIEHDGYVSDKWEQYLPAYEAVLRGFIDSAKPVRLLEIGAIPAADLITAVEPLERVAGAFAELENGSAMKVLINCNEGN